MKILGSGYVSDSRLGYRTFRIKSLERSLGPIIQRFEPDVVITHALNSVELARLFSDAGVPTMIYFRDVESADLGGSLKELRSVRYLANSEFTARYYRQHFEIQAHVIPPLLKRDLYVSSIRNPRYVTFINPVRQKGVELAFEIAAACPDLPFQFVESWPLNERELADLEAKIQGLPNIVFRRRTRNMKAIYSSTKLLIAPSRWAEGWGRVVSEAQFSGIPVIATDIGGLPEAVGPGGQLMSFAASSREWSDVIRHLWTSLADLERLGGLALAHSQREQLNVDRQIQTILEIATEHLQDANGRQ